MTNIATNTITTNSTTPISDIYNNYVTTTTGWVNYNHIYDSQPNLIEPKNNTKKEEEIDMIDDFGNFGPYSSNIIKLSPYGIAIKNKMGKWVSYNKDTKRIIDVDVLNINVDSSKIFYKIPRAVSSIAVGDTIIHNNTPVFVESIQDDRFTVINPYEGTAITILPAQSPFGFDYITALVSLTDYFPKADKENPFGNILPFVLMDKENNNLTLMLMLSGNMKDIDPMMLAAFGGNNLSSYLFMQMMKQDKEKK